MQATPEPKIEAQSRSLRALFGRRTQGGDFDYSVEDLEHFLPLILFEQMRERPIVDVSPEIDRLLGAFALRAELDLSAPVEEIDRRVQAYYREHPVHPELLREFALLTREELAAGVDLVRGGAIERLLCASNDTFKPAGPPKEGQVKGPIAAFALRNTTFNQ